MSVNDRDKDGLVSLARSFVDMGFHLVATHGTAEVLEAARPAAGARVQGQGGAAERG